MLPPCFGRGAHSAFERWALRRDIPVFEIVSRVRVVCRRTAVRRGSAVCVSRPDSGPVRPRPRRAVGRGRAASEVTLVYVSSVTLRVVK